MPQTQRKLIFKHNFC